MNGGKINELKLKSLVYWWEEKHITSIESGTQMGRVGWKDYWAIHIKLKRSQRRLRDCEIVITNSQRFLYSLDYYFPHSMYSANELGVYRYNLPAIKLFLLNTRPHLWVINSNNAPLRYHNKEAGIFL